MPSTVVRRAPKWPRAPCGTLLVPASSSSAWLSGGPLWAPRGSQGGAESPFSCLGVRPWPWDSAFGISSLLPTPGELRAPTCSTHLVAETQGFQALLSREAGVACTSNAGCPNALDCVAPGERRRAFLGHASRLDALKAHCFAQRSRGRTLESVLCSSGTQPRRFTSSNRRGLHQQYGRASNRAAILDWTCSFFIVSTSLCASWPLSKI